MSELVVSALGVQLVSEFMGHLESELTFDEGFRAFPYKDTLGYNTIAFGWNLDAHKLPPGYKPPLTFEEGVALLRISIQQTEESLIARLPWVIEFPEDARRGVLLDLSFNMGLLRLLGFTHMIGAFKAAQWQDAAAQLLDSKYAKQDVPKRAIRLANQLITNQWAVTLDIA